MRGVAFLPSADDGLLVTFESIGFDDLHGLAAATRSLDGVIAAIVGHSSVLVLTSARTSMAAIRTAMTACVTRGIAPRDVPVAARHEIEVDFSTEHAPDLALLLERATLSKDALLHRVVALELRARYLGFLPGFAYLEGWPEAWSLPRRAAVRERVPAGSFGIAGAVAGIYPGESPGGWNLVGRTGATLWDPRAPRPNMIAAGDVVTIRPGAFKPSRATTADEENGDEPLAEVLAPGVATIVTGGAISARYEFGLAPGGAFDPPAATLANRLAGNDDDALLLECAALGPKLRFLRSVSIAIAGATVDAAIDGTRVPMRSRIDVPAGATLEVGPIRGGMRVVVAVRGGFEERAPRWSVRPERLARGSTLYGARGTERRLPLVPPAKGDRLAIGAYAGPHLVDSSLLEFLADRQWAVTPSLDRTGVRLASGTPPAELPSLLPSCGMRAGTVQWHPGGELVVMGPDHPITGGYLQPLTLPQREVWKVAQLAPGDRVRFVLLR